MPCETIRVKRTDKGRAVRLVNSRAVAYIIEKAMIEVATRAKDDSLGPGNKELISPVIRQIILVRAKHRSPCPGSKGVKIFLVLRQII